MTQASLATLNNRADVNLAGTRDYYRDVTFQNGRYAGDASGWHYGIWEEDVTAHHQSLLRSNVWLVKDLPINADWHLLDAGCGCGGFATWAAAKFGCQVTGITLVAEHVDQAYALAAERGVAHLCHFQVAEMDNLPFEEASFDLVTNQDSFCHAVDKEHYLEGVKRVLKPGGYWRSVDFGVMDAELSEEEAYDYLDVLEGFQIPSMVSPEQVARDLNALSFVDVDCQDITDLVIPSADHILKMCRLPALAMKLKLDWTFFGLNAVQRRNRQGHVKAGAAYSRGLKAGYFRHGYYQGRNE